MAALGEDFSGGWFRRLYAPVNPTGFWWSLVFAAALLALHVLLQLIFSVIATLVLFDGAFDNMRIAVKSSLIAVFPASLLVAAAGWFFAQRNGGDPFRVLSLAQPRLSASGWIVLIAGIHNGDVFGDHDHRHRVRHRYQSVHARTRRPIAARRIGRSGEGGDVRHRE